MPRPCRRLIKGRKLEAAGRRSGCIIAKGRENASQIQPEQPIRRVRALGAKERWREEGRPARAACFYVMMLAHKPYKSGKILSEPLFPTIEAFIS